MKRETQHTVFAASALFPHSDMNIPKSKKATSHFGGEAYAAQGRANVARPIQTCSDMSKSHSHSHTMWNLFVVTKWANFKQQSRKSLLIIRHDDNVNNKKGQEEGKGFVKMGLNRE